MWSVKFFSILPLLSTFALSTTAANKKTYDGYQVLRTAVPTNAQFELLTDLMELNVFDFWRFPSLEAPAEIMVGPQDLQQLTTLLQSMELSSEVMVNDVQRSIEASERVVKSENGSSFYKLDWENYYQSDVIQAYLEYLAENYDFVTTESMATTFEGRDVLAIKIEKAGKGKKNVFMDATAHAREWITPAVVTFLIKELVENHEANAKYTDNLNFHIIPVVNPDGYDYSHRSDRLWRKTRSEMHSSECPGVDLNRNFPFDFGGPSASPNPCTSTYRGSHALSEPEALAMAKLFQSVDPLPELAISYHSAVDCFLYPYAHDSDVFPPNKEEVFEVCERSMEALNAVHGQEFFCMKATSLYPIGGCSMDWFASLGTRLSYTPELRNNGFGFLLPPEFILPSGEENWAALKVMMDKLLE